MVWFFQRQSSSKQPQEHRLLAKHGLEFPKWGDGEFDFEPLLETAKGFGIRIGPYACHAGLASAVFMAGLSAVQAAAYTCKFSSASPGAPAVGMLGVATASCLTGQFTSRIGFKPDGSICVKPGIKVDPLDLATDALVGVAAFKLTGGRFRSILPSNLAKPGAFSRQVESYPRATRGGDYASDGVKRELLVLYKRDGCHHCGTKQGTVIGDHMPPNKIAATPPPATPFKPPSSPIALLNEVITQFKTPPSTALVKATPQSVTAAGAGPLRSPQWFLPQCACCSSRQGGALSAGRTLLQMHFWQVRQHRLLTGPIVGMRYFSPMPVQVERNNRKGR